MSVEPPVITFDAPVTAGRNGFGAQTRSGNDAKSRKQESKGTWILLSLEEESLADHTHTPLPPNKSDFWA